MCRARAAERAIAVGFSPSFSQLIINASGQAERFADLVLTHSELRGWLAATLASHPDRSSVPWTWPLLLLRDLIAAAGIFYLWDTQTHIRIAIWKASDCIAPAKIRAAEGYNFGFWLLSLIIGASVYLNALFVGEHRSDQIYLLLFELSILCMTSSTELNFECAS